MIRAKYGDKIEPLEGNDPSSIIIFTLASIMHWVLAVSIGSYFRDNLWAVGLIGWTFGGFWAVASGLAMHEAAH